LVPRKYDKDPKLSTWVETQRILFNRDFRNIDPKGAVAAAAATAAATSVALADYASGNTDSSGPVYESTSVMATGGAVPHQEAANASFTSADSNPEGVPLPSIPGAAMIAADRGKRLTPERKQKLDEIGFVWSLRSKRIEDHWDDMFKQLVAYKVEHGDTLVPSRYQANLKLGKWYVIEQKCFVVSVCKNLITDVFDMPCLLVYFSSIRVETQRYELSMVEVSRDFKQAQHH
jgi:hypothetical protein